MASRTLIVFWASVAVATFLLGGAVSSARRISSGGGGGDVVLLAASVLGLAVALFVAGRIAMVAGRIKKAAKGRQ